MNNNQELVFRNRQFSQLKWVLLITPLLILAVYFLLPSGIISALIFFIFYMPIYIIIMFYVHPKQYVLKDNQLILRRVWFKDKVIEINDITGIELSKINCLNLRYNRSFQKLIIPELEMRLFQEELMKSNPSIEIIYSKKEPV